MTDTALRPIDTTPLAFEAHLTGAVLGTADQGVKVAIRSKSEINADDFLRMCELARAKQMGYVVFVPDAESMDEVTIPPKPEAPASTKKEQSPSQKHRFALQTLAEELDKDPNEYYLTEMSKSTAKVWEKIEDIRREKAFLGGGGN